jgi:aminopeptidase N
VANAPPLEERAGYARFAGTRPISTYLFAFAAGPFRVVARNGEPVRLFVRQSRLARARAVAPELLRLNRAALGRFARFCGHPFPFAKYDLVLIPDFHYGGMEHAGATFLREDRILLRHPRSPYWRRRRALLLLHETAHQWLGNLVTMRWFDDLWLKEGFANYLAYGALQALAPEFDGERAWAELAEAGRRAAAKPGAPALHVPLANLASARSVYTDMVYCAAPAMLRCAEREFGMASFRRSVQAFVRRHAWGAADWRDLVRALERGTGRDLAAWARSRILRPGALAGDAPGTRAMGIQSKP